MKLIIGLGNPGKKYELTRHNIGFIVLDYIAKKYNTPISKMKFKSYYNEIRVGNEKVVLLKPQTYMNLSGEAVMSVVKYYDVELEDVLVIYDDIDIDFGVIRIRKKGSAGGHKGMESIIQYLHSEEIPRLRIGIGYPSVNFNFDCVSYVLSNFNGEEEDKIKETIKLSTKAMKTVIEDDFEKAMRKYNRKSIEA